jgi:hypothetical protein
MSGCLTRDDPLTPYEELVAAIAEVIVASSGRRNLERAEAVLTTINIQGWDLVRRDG